jgi:hypothetical protein
MLSQKINSLDLSKVKEKLTHHSGENWSLEKANLVEVEYKKFLNLCLNHPNKNIGITYDADKFWHQHILDTKQYSKDCEEIFGKFLHHDPYLFDEHPLHSDAINNLKNLYQQEYNEDVTKNNYAASGALLDLESKNRTEFAASGSLLEPKNEKEMTFAASGALA